MRFLTGWMSRGLSSAWCQCDWRVGGCSWVHASRVGFDHVPFSGQDPTCSRVVPPSTSRFETVARVSRWIQAHRARFDARPWQRAATCWTQAVLGLRWLRDGTSVDLLARDATISRATGYPYLHEAIDVIAEQAPDLTEVLAHGREAGWAFVCLDGTLIDTSRSSAKSTAGHDIWYSGEHHAHGGNIQVVADPSGYPVWTSEVEPGCTHDITCAPPTRSPRSTRLPQPGSRPWPTRIHRRRDRHRDPHPECQPRHGQPGPETSSPRYAHRPNAPTRYSSPLSKPFAGSPCAPGAGRLLACGGHAASARRAAVSVGDVAGGTVGEHVGSLVERVSWSKPTLEHGTPRALPTRQSHWYH